MSEKEPEVQEVGFEIHLGQSPHGDLKTLLTGLNNLQSALSDLGYDGLLEVYDCIQSHEYTHPDDSPHVKTTVKLNKDSNDNTYVIFRSDNESLIQYMILEHNWADGIDHLLASLKEAGVKEITSHLSFTVTLC